MKNLLHTLAIIVVSLGIVSCFVIAPLLGQVAEIDYVTGGIVYRQQWGLTLFYFAILFFVVLSLFAILEGISKVLGNQEAMLFKLNSAESKEDNNDGDPYRYIRESRY